MTPTPDFKKALEALDYAQSVTQIDLNGTSRIGQVLYPHLPTIRTALSQSIKAGEDGVQVVTEKHAVNIIIASWSAPGMDNATEYGIRRAVMQLMNDFPHGVKITKE